MPQAKNNWENLGTNVITLPKWKVLDCAFGANGGTSDSPLLSWVQIMKYKLVQISEI